MLKRRRSKKTGFLEDIPFYKSIILCILMFFSFIFITQRLLDLQIIRRDIYQREAEKNIFRATYRSSPRGSIYDRNGVKLAEDVSSFHLFVDFSMISDLDIFSDGLSDAVLFDKEKLNELSKSAQGKNDLHLIKSNLTEEEIARFQETVFQFDPERKVVHILEGFKRHYPYNNLLSHVIGYTGIVSSEDLLDERFKNYHRDDRIGKQGIERFYEQLLRGKPGRTIQQIDAFGKIIKETVQVEPQKGQDIYLTIDIRLQSKVEKIIQNHIGTCIMINPSNGEILAMASYPDYNPNIFSKEIQELIWLELLEKRSFFNIAHQGSYAPGSTFKPLATLFAYEHNIIKPEDIIVCQGSIDMPGLEGKYRCHVFPGRHGPLKMTEAMKVSCDVYFYELAKKFSIESFLTFIEDVGSIGLSTGIDLPFENIGFLGSPEYKNDYYGFPWFDGDSMNLGIGQGFISVTPLQLANLYSVIANGGKYIQPHLLLNPEQSLSADALKKQKKVQQYKISMKNIERIHSDLISVAKPGGTAWALESKILTIAAKTGTAQGILSKENEITWDLWLAAFAPAHQPDIVSVMMFENSSLEFGGNLAPLMKELLEYWINLRIPNGGNNA